MLNKLRMLLVPYVIAQIALLQGCASVSSEVIRHNGVNSESYKDADISDGVVYYVPNRPIRINYTIAESKSDKNRSDVTFGLVDNSPTDTVPDVRNMFLLRYNKNYVGRNHMYMSVNRHGLLSVSHSATISRVNEIAKNIATSVAAATIGAGAEPGATDHTVATPISPTPLGSFPSISYPQVTLRAARKCAPGDYSILVFPEKSLDIGDAQCGIQLQVKRGFDEALGRKESDRLNSQNWMYRIYNKLDMFHLHNQGGSLPGLFYKQELPYIVTLKNQEAQYDFTALSPNESGIYFAPITKTLFSDNTSDITLINGIINTLEEATDSEALALSKIPSDAIGSYTTSLGNIFSAVGTTLSNEKTMIGNQMELNNALLKKRTCDVAIASNPIEGKKGDDLTSALNNIQNACR